MFEICNRPHPPIPPTSETKKEARVIKSVTLHCYTVLVRGTGQNWDSENYFIILHPTRLTHNQLASGFHIAHFKDH